MTKPKLTPAEKHTCYRKRIASKVKERGVKKKVL